MDHQEKLSKVPLTTLQKTPVTPRSPTTPGNGKRQTVNAKRTPISTKERSLFLLLITNHLSRFLPFPAMKAFLLLASKF
jgi:hypothetical protein